MRNGLTHPLNFLPMRVNKYRILTQRYKKTCTLKMRRLKDIVKYCVDLFLQFLHHFHHAVQVGILDTSVRGVTF